MKRILMVTGDAGSARVLKPVYQILNDKGFSVKVLVDGNKLAKAGGVWSKDHIDFSIVHSFLSETIDELVKLSDIVIAGTCKTAYFLERDVIQRAKLEKKVTVLASDTELNFLYSQFSDLRPDFWLAINSAHQIGIMDLHNFSKRHVPVIGDPQMDNLHCYLNHQEIGEKIRGKLSVNERKLIVWWAPGDIERFSSAFAFVTMGLMALNQAGYDTVFVPRIHPKMDVQSDQKGYLPMFYEQIKIVTDSLNIEMMRADTIKLEELCLAADVTCGCFTGGVTKGARLGKPVIHLFTLHEQKLAKESFGLDHPFMPEILHEAALGAFSPEDAKNTFLDACKAETVKKIKDNALQLFQLEKDAAQKIADFLIKL